MRPRIFALVLVSISASALGGCAAAAEADDASTGISASNPAPLTRVGGPSVLLSIVMSNDGSALDTTVSGSNWCFVDLLSLRPGEPGELPVLTTSITGAGVEYCDEAAVTRTHAVHIPPDLTLADGDVVMVEGYHDVRIGGEPIETMR